MKIIVIIIIVSLFIIIAYFIRKWIILSSVNGAYSEIVIPLSTFSTNGPTNECSYSLWFNVENWATGYKGYTGQTGTNEKILFKQTDPENKIQFMVMLGNYVNTLNIFLPEINDLYRESINCKITNKSLGDTSLNNEQECQQKCTNSVEKCGSYSYEYSKKTSSKDKITWNLLGILNGDGIEGVSDYDIKPNKSTTLGWCKGIIDPDGVTGTVSSGICWYEQFKSVTGVTGAENICNKDKDCKGFSFSKWGGSTGSSGSTRFYKDLGGIETQVNLTDETDAFYGSKTVPAEEMKGTCYLYPEFPSMPRTCFLGETGSVGKPYSAYDWNEFMFNSNYSSGVKLPGCSIKEVPVQEWVNLIITIQDKTIEIYINGKMVKYCTLSSSINTSEYYRSTVTITPTDYGFDGNTYNFKYWGKCLTTEEINKLSKKVFG